MIDHGVLGFGQSSKYGSPCVKNPGPPFRNYRYKAPIKVAETNQREGYEFGFNGRCVQQTRTCAGCLLAQQDCLLDSALVFEPLVWAARFRQDQTRILRKT